MYFGFFFIQELKVRFDFDEVFKKKVYEVVVQLQSYDKDYINVWKFICDVLRKGLFLIFLILKINYLKLLAKCQREREGNVENFF